MKEFLDTAKLYTYVKDTAKRSEDWIEIPSGADTYLELNKRNLAFYKDNFKYCYLSDTEGWVKTDGCSDAFLHYKALWKRKEYLFKGIDGNYKVVDHDCQGRAIEIPEGAVKAVIDSASSYGFPEKKVYFIFMVDKKEYGIFNGEFREIFYANSTIIWSRHTQPDELPFVDDDCFPKQDHGSPLIRPFISVDDQVNHPNHYTSGSIECIDAIESSMSKEAFAGFLKGNVQKYMWRYENKGAVESLQKAQWYLNRLILLQSAHG